MFRKEKVHGDVTILVILRCLLPTSPCIFFKATVGQSPPATKYINKVGRTNKLTKYLKGGREEDT
jgi:hypothetical protein